MCACILTKTCRATLSKTCASDAVVVHKLLALLDTATADEMRNQLRYI